MRMRIACGLLLVAPAVCGCSGNSSALISAECKAWQMFVIDTGLIDKLPTTCIGDPCACYSRGAMGSTSQVKCGANGQHITTISFQSTYGPTGVIPAALEQLPELVELTLQPTEGTGGYNGTIPAFLGKLTKLKTLQLGYNQLRGLIPHDLPFSTYSQYKCNLGQQRGATGPQHYDEPIPAGAVKYCGVAAPAPTPVMYSCNAATGQCAQDPMGSQSAESCIAGCHCVTPHNCGQLNNTIACNKPVIRCNVCDACCQTYISIQASCDGCFAAPAGPFGCGNQTSGHSMTFGE